MEAAGTSTRLLAPIEGRESIRYDADRPTQGTTQLFLIDNKSADISAFNADKDHSDFFTTIVHDTRLPVEFSTTKSVTLDGRSRWVGETRLSMRTNAVNCNSFFQTSSFRALIPSHVEGTTDTVKFQWQTITLPEGNYPLGEYIDLMNEAMYRAWQRYSKPWGVSLNDGKGIKFDTRNFRLGVNEQTNMMDSGVYLYKGYHADVVLAPGFAVDFTHSRLSNILGWRRRQPYADEDFIIRWEDLAGGNLPALKDPTSSSTNPSPLRTDSATGLSFHVEEAPGSTTAKPRYQLKFRSLFLAYDRGAEETLLGTVETSASQTNHGQVYKKFLLTESDITGGMGQLYLSLPDLCEDPVTFVPSSDPSRMPVSAMFLMPANSKRVYSQQSIQLPSNSDAYVLNRWPSHQVWIASPPMTVFSVMENDPLEIRFGDLPLKNTLNGVQRVVVTDAQRRTVPYVAKATLTCQPRTAGSRTLL
ncbi:III [Red-eared slider adenovirus 1]|uniref:III n=1 Tax=Red-eared slider adenovirus 1 TaxID=2749458 RepID=UPI002481C6BF|nr:III [Red-eared slider adenovirus 1]QLD29002.1 III [Red-eared slider adenovirus 1]